jgi:hypothetical protein
MFIGDGGETDYVWNNVIYNITGNAPETEFRNGTVTQYWYNNVFMNAVGGFCLGSTGSAGSSRVFVKNNHCIGGALPSNGGAYTVSNNLTQTISQAASQGYTTSGSYFYAPQDGSGSTVNTGANLTTGASWPSGFPTSDTVYSCTLQTVNRVIQSVCPARKALARPTSGAWDVGAYLFASSVAGPQPPAGLTAYVQ